MTNITIPVDDETKARFQRIADKKDIPMARLMRRIIMAYLRDRAERLRQRSTHDE